MENIREVFEKFDDEYIKFEMVENKLSNRPDLHAFMLLDSLMPGDVDIISAAYHDEIYISIEIDDLSRTNITEDQVRDLRRCGLRIGEYGLCMFV